MWAVWGHFQGSSLCLTSSVCWSLQCLISVLTQGGRCWTLFFFLAHCSVALWGGRDTADKYYWRVFVVSHPRWACACLRRTPLRLYVAPPGNCLRPALGFMHLPGLSRSGSVLRKPSEVQIWLGLRFVPFPGQVRVAQECGERGRCDLSPFLSLLLSFLGGPLAPLVRQMVTVQHPQQS